jgi:hypothetical protein
VKLFSSILKREDDRYYLVTPVEKVGITVDDAPFVAVDFTAQGEGAAQTLSFETQVEERVTAGPDHPIRVETDPASGEPRPYVHVRAGLEALIARAVFYDLVEMAERRSGRLGLTSNGAWFDLGEAA